MLREKPYTQKEAEAAVDLRTDDGNRGDSKPTACSDNLFKMDVEDTLDS